ncbi:MAG: site-specific integrase [Bacteroides sp.]|nr:site-specific integrase [Bacteroides sp.]
MKTSKEPVRLRKRIMPSGNTSLYLDIYHNGTRTYEYLKMYLSPENTRKDKERNKETLQLAEAVRAKRVVELRNGIYGFAQQSRNVKFFDYFNELCRKKYGERKVGEKGSWFSLLAHLELYERNKNITFEQTNAEWVKGFKSYLDKASQAKAKKAIPLSRNTKHLYFEILRSVFKHAYNDYIIRKNPCSGIEKFKKEETQRNYLTIDEIRKLSDTECDHPNIKKAFLFSCLTGLRRSDIINLHWGDVHEQGGFTRIIFRQRKTGGQEYLDITPQAVECMGQRGFPEDTVFRGILGANSTNIVLERWVKEAGINKKITFHCARHTFAVMMLDLGTDIYTVSKLLGHRELSTTQIYAKILDKGKQAAVASIPSILYD